MARKTAKLGYVGITFGSIALLMALVHFWAGPFSPQPTLETAVAEKVISIKKVTIKALKGDVHKETHQSRWDKDKVIDVSTAVLGGLALIVSVLSLASHEPKRVAVGGAILGISAISFQFFAMFAMVLLFILLISAILSGIGFG